MPTPSETFISWKAEIAVEMTAAREQMEAAEAVLAQARASLAAAEADQRALADELARIAQPTTDYRTGQTVRTEVAAPLRLRLNSAIADVRQAKAAVVRAELHLEEPKVLIAELKIALEQIEWLGKPANAEAVE